MDINTVNSSLADQEKYRKDNAEKVNLSFNDSIFSGAAEETKQMYNEIKSLYNNGDIGKTDRGYFIKNKDKASLLSDDVFRSTFKTILSVQEGIVNAHKPAETSLNQNNTEKAHAQVQNMNAKALARNQAFLDAASARMNSYDAQQKINSSSKPIHPNMHPDDITAQFWDAWDRFDDRDKARLSLAAIDAASAFAGYIPGAHIGAAAVGVGATIGNAYLDYTDDNVGFWESTGNLGIGLGLDALSLVGGKGLKSMKAIADAMPLIRRSAPALQAAVTFYAVAGGLDALRKTQFEDLAKKDISQWEAGDYMNALAAAQFLMAGGKAALRTAGHRIAGGNSKYINEDGGRRNLIGRGKANVVRGAKKVQNKFGFSNQEAVVDNSIEHNIIRPLLGRASSRDLDINFKSGKEIKGRLRAKQREVTLARKPLIDGKNIKKHAKDNAFIASTEKYIKNREKAHVASVGDLTASKAGAIEANTKYKASEQKVGVSKAKEISQIGKVKEAVKVEGHTKDQRLIQRKNTDKKLRKKNYIEKNTKQKNVRNKKLKPAEYEYNVGKKKRRGASEAYEEKKKITSNEKTRLVKRKKKVIKHIEEADKALNVRTDAQKRVKEAVKSTKDVKEQITKLKSNNKVVKEKVSEKKKIKAEKKANNKKRAIMLESRKKKLTGTINILESKKASLESKLKFETDRKKKKALSNKIDAVNAEIKNEKNSWKRHHRKVASAGKSAGSFVNKYISKGSNTVALNSTDFRHMKNKERADLDKKRLNRKRAGKKTPTLIQQSIKFMRSHEHGGVIGKPITLVRKFQNGGQMSPEQVAELINKSVNATNYGFIPTTDEEGINKVYEYLKTQSPEFKKKLNEIYFQMYDERVVDAIRNDYIGTNTVDFDKKWGNVLGATVGSSANLVQRNPMLGHVRFNGSTTSINTRGPLQDKKEYYSTASGLDDLKYLIKENPLEAQRLEAIAGLEEEAEEETKNNAEGDEIGQEEITSDDEVKFDENLATKESALVSTAPEKNKKVETAPLEKRNIPQEKGKFWEGAGTVASKFNIGDLYNISQLFKKPKEFTAHYRPMQATSEAEQTVKNMAGYDAMKNEANRPTYNVKSSDLMAKVSLQKRNSDIRNKKVQQLGLQNAQYIDNTERANLITRNKNRAESTRVRNINNQAINERELKDAQLRSINESKLTKRNGLVAAQIGNKFTSGIKDLMFNKNARDYQNNLTVDNEYNKFTNERNAFYDNDEEINRKEAYANWEKSEKDRELSDGDTYEATTFEYTPKYGADARKKLIANDWNSRYDIDPNSTMFKEEKLRNKNRLIRKQYLRSKDPYTY